jgi:MazG family protein
LHCSGDWLHAGAMPLPIPSADLPPITRLREVVHCLRAPGGCPWDQEQTHESLIPHVIEEAYEVVEAIRSGDAAAMCDELGDLLLQSVLHAEIASETGAFDLDSMAQGLSEKLIRRHPHVFGEANAADSDAVLAQWDAIKATERPGKPKGLLHGVGKGLPALMKGQKLQKKAAKVGFDWPDTEPVFGKISEETLELREAMATGDRMQMEHELGDLLFSVVNLARKLGLDAEAALAGANERFTQRFSGVEAKLTAQGLSMESATLAQMDAAWEEVKSEGTMR